MKSIKEQAKIFKDFDYGVYSIEDLVEKYRETKDDTYVGILIYRISSFMYEKVRKYYSLSDDDKEHVCLLALTKALKDFDYSKNIRFLTLYGTYLKNGLKTELKNQTTMGNKLNSNCVSIDDLVIVREPKKVVSRKDILDYCKLTKQEENLIELLYKEFNISEISTFMCLDRRTINRIIEKIKNKIKENLEIEYIY